MVQVAVSRARSSVTMTAPKAAEMVVPGAPMSREAVVGAVIVRAPEFTEKVTVVSGSPPEGLLVEECASDVPGSTADGLLLEECACADGFGAADATPGASAIPVTVAAVKT